MRALIKSELHMNSPYVDSAIADAIDFCKKEPLKFNGSSYTLNLYGDQHSYDLPKDYIALRGDIFITPADSGTQYRYKLKSGTISEVEEYLFANPAASDYLSNDSTFIYAIDVNCDEGSKILVAPRPSTGGQTLFFRYTKDIGTPKYTSSITTSTPPSLNNTITLLGPDGETLASTFTNAWFKEGSQLIRARAIYLLWTSFHGGTEQAAIKAQGALMKWNEEMMKHRSEAAVNALPSRMRRYI
jgi:hypothetical protein